MSDIGAMNNFLLYIGAFFVIIFSTLLGVPYFVDWNSYRGVFEEEASRVLGREVRVGGNVELKLLPSPYFQVEKIRIGSAASGETKGSFIKADDFRIWISVPPLLKGVLEAKSVELTKPIIQTALDTEGRLAIGSSQLKQGGVYSLFNNISLQSVKFIDGSLGFIAPNGSDLVRFENINGELSADALDGPFRFAGEYVQKNETRQIRINTGKSDENGSVRFKAQVLSPNSTNTYTVDAVASDLFGHPRIEGDFKGKINGSYILSKSLLGETHLDFEKVQQALNLEVNSLIKITGTDLKLDEITINSESIIPPKLLSGRSLFTWKDQLSADISFSSSQIDFDKIFASEGNDNTKDPLTFISVLTKAFVSEWPEQADVKFELSVDDLGITKQNIKALHFLAETVGNSVQIKDARALLPGDTKFLLNGEISGEKNSRGLSGTLSLDGRRLNLFSHWLSKEGPLFKSEEDATFSLSGEIKASSENVQLDKMKVLTNGNLWNGEVKVSFADRPSIKLDLQSEKMDLDASGQRTFLDKIDALTGVLPLEGLSGEEKSPLSKGTKSAQWVQKADWELNLKSNVLKRMGVEVQNFEWAANSKNKNIVLSKIKFQSANEFAIALQSPTTDGSAPSKRTLEGKIEILSPEAGEKIFKIFRTSEEFKKTFKNSAPMTPWNLDCVFNFEESNEILLDFNIRGSVRDGRAEISGFLHDPLGDWRKGPAKLIATVESPKIISLFREDVKEKSPPSDFESNTSGKFFLSSEGKPIEGMQTLAKVQTKESEAEFKGALTFSDNTKLLKDGNIVFNSKNLNEFFLISALLPQWTFQAVPLKGSLTVRDDGKKVYIKTEKILIGDASLSAEMSWASETTERISGLEALVDVNHV
ncbi:MAG: AsmA family protein, partial [Hyphomicrobium sp.]